MSPSEINLLLAAVDQAFNQPSWHGPNLRSVIRGVSVPVARFRPTSNRHNIWEHVVHAAYWKYVVRRRLTGEKRGSFALEGSNWFVRPREGNSHERAWKADVRLLEDAHRALREAIASFPPKALHRPIRGARSAQVTPAWLISGVAMHDIYHAGQIGLIKRLAHASV